MNKIVNKFLLTRETFMLEFHFRVAELTYSTCGPFTKHCERIQKLKEAGDLNYICKNKYHKICFAQDAVYADSKDLAKRTVSDKVLKNRADKIAPSPKYEGYQ